MSLWNEKIWAQNHFVNWFRSLTGFELMYSTNRKTWVQGGPWNFVLCEKDKLCVRGSQRLFINFYIDEVSLMLEQTYLWMRTELSSRLVWIIKFLISWVQCLAELFQR